MTAVLFVVFIVCLMLSFPVAIAMGIAAITPGMLDTALSADVVYIIRTMVVGIDSTPILAIPLFILSGTIMAQGGISGKLFDLFAYFLGKRTGGLPCGCDCHLSVLWRYLRKWSGHLCCSWSYDCATVGISWL